MSISKKFACANKRCDLCPLTATDSRIEVKAVVPAGMVSHIQKSMCVKWSRNGEASFHNDCWKSVLKVARSRGTSKTLKKKKDANETANGGLVMMHSEKLMVKEAAKTSEMFDSLEDIRKAATKTAALILKSKHCIIFTGAGVSTSAGIGDFRGKSGKWTEENTSAMGGLISEALLKDLDAAPSSSSAGGGEGAVRCAEKVLVVKGEPSASEDPAEEAEEEAVDYENLRPTYTHEALTLMMEKGLVSFIISQNCDGLHLLSGTPSDRISELHGNVYVERCPSCLARYSQNFYVLHDEASQYYEELEDLGETELRKPKFAVKCSLCGLCHRTGRKCEKKGCCGFLEDTIINFGDNLEESVLSLAFEQANLSDLAICLGTTLKVTPASDIIEGLRPLVICNRQKTEQDSGADVRVFGDCDVFMRMVLKQLIAEQQCTTWEGKRDERMQEYDAKRKPTAMQPRKRSSSNDAASEVVALKKEKK